MADPTHRCTNKGCAMYGLKINPGERATCITCHRKLEPVVPLDIEDWLKQGEKLFGRGFS